MDLFLQTETWIALLTLSFLEIVLGIDNIIFISIVTNKLPEDKQDKTRITGISIALVFRILLLLGIAWIIGFTQPVFSLLGFDLSGRDIILLCGGIFLLAKSTTEIHEKMLAHEEKKVVTKSAKVKTVIFQIIMLDMIFSFDSILTAVGLTEHVIIMIIAVVIAMVIMMFSSGAIARFINTHPTLQVLALSFLILIGFMLIMDGVHYHIPKGYIYFAVVFSLGVEFLNMKIRDRHNKKKGNNLAT